MKFSRIIRRRIRASREGVNVAADVNAAVAGTVNQREGNTSVSSKHTIVQRGGRTQTTTHEEADHGRRQA